MTHKNDCNIIPVTLTNIQVQLILHNLLFHQCSQNRFQDLFRRLGIRHLLEFQLLNLLLVFLLIIHRKIHTLEYHLTIQNDHFDNCIRQFDFQQVHNQWGI